MIADLLEMVLHPIGASLILSAVVLSISELVRPPKPEITRPKDDPYYIPTKPGSCSGCGHPESDCHCLERRYD